MCFCRHLVAQQSTHEEYRGFVRDLGAEPRPLLRRHLRVVAIELKFRPAHRRLYDRGEQRPDTGRLVQARGTPTCRVRAYLCRLCSKLPKHLYHSYATIWQSTDHHLKLQQLSQQQITQDRQTQQPPQLVDSLCYPNLYHPASSRQCQQP